MIYHLTILEENSKVIIRTSEHIPQSINLWLEVDLYAKNSLKYIDAMKLFNKLGTDLCRALTAFHVCTGSDYTAAFSRKGKIHPLKEKDKDKNEKNKTAQTVLETWDSLMLYKKNSKSLKTLLAPYMENQNLILSMR